MWTLVSPSPAVASGSNEYVLPNEGVAHIVLDEHASHAQVVRLMNSRMQRELGRIVAGPFGVKLEAVTEKLAIAPGRAHATSSPTARFELQPRNDNHSEAIFLRHGDTIHFSSLKSSFACQWTDSEVQVNSSAAPDARAIAATPGDETGDETEDEDLNEPATAVSAQNKESHPRATPQLLHQQSLVVQETPMAARVNSASNSMTVNIDPPKFTDNMADPVDKTPNPSQKPVTESDPVTETFSTARTGESQTKSAAAPKGLQNADIPPSADASMMGTVASKRGTPLRTRIKSSPQVQIPPRSTRKRSTSAVDEVSQPEDEARAGPNKRTKTSNDDDIHDSQASSIVVKSQGSTKNRKERMTDVAETDSEEEDFTRSPRSSGQSTPVITEAYDGPPPRVASSNSTITKNSQAVKLLKKQGGAYVEKLTENFDVLCVRDGDLQKKTKVLYALAHGIPIVTDAWLLDSAKKGRLLSLSAYKPSTSKQEEEWKFKFDDVFGKPQTPFKGYTIHFTKSLKAVYESFSEVTAVCKAAGARNVTSTRMNTTGDNIVLASSYEDDPEAQKLIKDGITCYTKDLFTYSIFRGILDLESDEFKINGPVSGSASSKENNKRGRKST